MITGDELSFGEGHDQYQTKQGRFACKQSGSLEDTFIMQMH